jgi:3-oxoacyl-ACP reductase-like protein
MNENNQEQQGVENWGDYKYPLACRMLKQTDAFSVGQCATSPVIADFNPNKVFNTLFGFGK